MGQDIKKFKVRMQKFLDDFVLWTETYGFETNPTKTVMQVYSRKWIEISILRVKGHVIENRKEHKLLGITLDSPNITWKAHIDYLRINCIQQMKIMKVMASTKWGATTKIMRLCYAIHNLPFNTHTTEYFKNANILKLNRSIWISNL